jgi:hypothetical protein
MPRSASAREGVVYYRPGGHHRDEDDPEEPRPAEEDDRDDGADLGHPVRLGQGHEGECHQRRQGRGEQHAQQAEGRATDPHAPYSTAARSAAGVETSR